MADYCVETFDASGYDLSGWTERVGAGCTVNEDYTTFVPAGMSGHVLRCVFASSGWQADCYDTDRMGAARTLAYEHCLFHCVSTALQAGEDHVFLYTAEHNNSGDWVSAWNIANIGGSLYLQFTHYDQGGSSATVTVLEITTGKTYRLESKWEKAGSPVWHVRVNGANDQSGSGTAPQRDHIGHVAFGVPNWGYQRAAEYIIDDLKYGDAWYGGGDPEPSTPTTHKPRIYHSLLLMADRDFL